MRLRESRAGIELTIRRLIYCEHKHVRDLVQTVVDETYGGLWAQPPLQIDEEDWSLAWVAVAGSKVIGTALTLEEWVSDLWVLPPSRGLGAGTMLLRRAEMEIAERGHRHAKLRLVRSNTKALRFYERRGWLLERHFPHEHLPITMTEMRKAV